MKDVFNFAGRSAALWSTVKGRLLQTQEWRFPRDNRLTIGLWSTTIVCPSRGRLLKFPVRRGGWGGAGVRAGWWNARAQV